MPNINKLILASTSSNVLFIDRKTLRMNLSAAVSGIQYQLTRKYGDTFIKTVGIDSSTRLSPEVAAHLDQLAKRAARTSTFTIPVGSGFSSGPMFCSKRKRPYDDRKIGDTDITSSQLTVSVSESYCSYIIGKFMHAAHMANGLGIAHVGYNAYSKADTDRTLSILKEYPLTFEALCDSLSATPAYVDLVLRKLNNESKLGPDVRTTFVPGKVYSQRTLEFFSPKVIELIKSVEITAAPDAIKYVSIAEISDRLELKEVSNPWAQLDRLGLRPSRRSTKRCMYILAEAEELISSRHKFSYTADEVADEVGVSVAVINNYTRDGVISAHNTSLLTGCSPRRRYTEEAIDEAIAYHAVHNRKSRWNKDN